MKIENKLSNDIFRNSTKTFRNIMEKYTKKIKANKNNRQLFLSRIEKKINNIKNEEKENEFIIKEVKKNIKIKLDLLSSFGNSAIYHCTKPNNSKIKIKLSKSKFFNPLLDYTNSNYSKSSRNRKKNNEKYNSHKIINFPKISNIITIQKPFDKNRISKDYSLLKVNEYSFDTKNDSSDIDQNKSKDSSTLKKFIFFNKKNKEDNNNINEKILVRSDTSNNISESSKKDLISNFFPSILKTPLKTERNISSFTNIRINNNNKKKIVNNLFNFDCLNNLKNIREKLLLQEKKNQKYFENNHYGCDKYKLKYNYLICCY